MNNKKTTLTINEAKEKLKLVPFKGMVSMDNVNVI